jgi:NAD(P)-dependent dehydrogenase (short-subunit alcohol dehydrogenase family)
MPIQAADAVSATVARFGRIDSLVNDAGRGLLGAVKEVSETEARAIFDVNVFGLLTVTRAVLPIMRAQRAGKIINISSSGGFIGRAGWGSTVRRNSRSRASPRAWDTNSRRSESKSRRSSPADSARTSSTRAASSRPARGSRTTPAPRATREWARRTNYAQPGDPATAAKVIVDLAGRESLPERIQLGEDCFTAVAARSLSAPHVIRPNWREISISTALMEAVSDDVFSDAVTVYIWVAHCDRGRLAARRHS